MAKTSKIEREKKLVKLAQRYEKKRAELKAIIKNPDTPHDERMQAVHKLADLPRDSSPVRQKNRCQITGRPRAYMRKFRLCRVIFRDLAHEGQIPGVTKSSW